MVSLRFSLLPTAPPQGEQSGTTRLWRRVTSVRGRCQGFCLDQHLYPATTRARYDHSRCQVYGSVWLGGARCRLVKGKKRAYGARRLVPFPSSSPLYTQTQKPAPPRPSNTNLTSRRETITHNRYQSSLMSRHLNTERETSRQPWGPPIQSREFHPGQGTPCLQACIPTRVCDL
jgi:hypothetical protein